MLAVRKKLKSLYRFGCNLVNTPAVILLYHRVTDLPLDPQQLAVSPENFDCQVRHLRERYSLLAIDEFTDIVTRHQKMPERAVVLTFDDGYADNFYEARLILERHHAQALFYIATALLDTPYEFWWDDLERIFLTGDVFPQQLSLRHAQLTLDMATDTKAARLQAYQQLQPLIKALTAAPRTEVMGLLQEWANLPAAGRTTHRIMTTEELRKFSQSPAVVIGAHTHTHSRLKICPPEEQSTEILTSKKILEDLLQKPIEHFSYPFGTQDDYSDVTREICRHAGFRMVSANYHNQVHSWHDPMELPRMLVRNWPLEKFQTHMKSFFHW
jgi:peptidoglycan/xylan/chitin deacetylase (PgdA/CDA1 family)